MNSDDFCGSGIPLLAKEGWTRHQENIAKHPLKERTGWSLISHILTMHSETWLVSDHPVCAASVASRFFLYGAATPPSQGGEWHSNDTRGHLFTPSWTAPTVASLLPTSRTAACNRGCSRKWSTRSVLRGG